MKINGFFKKLRRKMVFFWKENIEKNYKKISIAFGMMIIYIFQWIFLDKLTAVFPDAKHIWNGVFLFITALSIGIFGGKDDGNGYYIPSQKKLEVVFKRNPSWRKKFEKEYKEFLLEQELCRRRRELKNGNTLDESKGE